MAVLVSGAPAGAQGPITKADKDELVFMRNEHPAMRKAFDKASQRPWTSSWPKRVLHPRITPAFH